MQLIIKAGISLVVAYILGSFPSGYIVGKLVKGIDVRLYGSHKTGATNVLRTVGVGPAITVVILDLGKGVLAILLTRYLIAPGLPWLELFAATGALLGHNFPLFIRFRGGRGVLTGAGIVLAMNWLVLLLAAPIALIVIIVSRYVSLGSIIGALSCPVIALLLLFLGHAQPPDVLMFLAGSIFVTYAHKDNIQRLIHGNERKISFGAAKIIRDGSK